jgi:N-acetylglutamate synthase-like GNAT family acetyltransferase
VSRTPFEVRELAVADGPALHTLWAARLPGAVREVPPATYAEHVLEMIRDQQDAAVLVAEADGEVVGAAYLHRELVAPVPGGEVLQVALLAVAPSRTRRGVGRALVEGAVSHAETLGIENVLVVGGPSDRETNRFFARLGLTQIAVLRGARVSALRARLPQEVSGGPGLVRAPRRSRQVGQVVAARRTQRRTRSHSTAH